MPGNQILSIKRVCVPQVKERHFCKRHDKQRDKCCRNHQKCDYNNVLHRFGNRNFLPERMIRKTQNPVKHNQRDCNDCRVFCRDKRYSAHCKKADRQNRAQKRIFNEKFAFFDGDNRKNRRARKACKA